MGTKTKKTPPRVRVVYRRTDPYGTERPLFEVVAEFPALVSDDTRYRECAYGQHTKCEGSTVAPVTVCTCACHVRRVD